jgi:hypothetical protein
MRGLPRGRKVICRACRRDVARGVDPNAMTGIEAFDEAVAGERGMFPAGAGDLIRTRPSRNF